MPTVKVYYIFLDVNFPDFWTLIDRFLGICEIMVNMECHDVNLV